MKKTKQNIILSIGFDSVFPQLFFEIKNPVVLPKQGEIFHCKWSDFIKDKDILKLLWEYEENDVWLVNIISKDFSRKKIVIHISLFESKSYLKYYYTKYKL